MNQISKQLEMSSIDPNVVHEFLSGELEQELENVLNHPAPGYAEPSYWNERYMSNPNPYDWFQPWSAFKSIVLPLIPSKESAIDLGCGNSPMTSELLSDGFNNVVGFDISSVVIDQNKKKFANENRLEWEVGNVFNLSKYPDESFDAVFDKGTFDCIMSSGINALQISQFLQGVSRILKKKGVFVEISYGLPETRLSWLQNPKYGWKQIESRQVEQMSERGYYHYVYCFQKKDE